MRDNPINIVTAQHVGEYRMYLEFDDGNKHIIDFEAFLTRSKNPQVRQWLNPEKFSEFRLVCGELVWGDYDFCIPVINLYHNDILHVHTRGTADHSSGKVNIMNPIPKRLVKEPLIEAIWQLQFESAGGHLGDILPGMLFTALREAHPKLKLQRLPSADIPAQMAQADPNLRYMARYRMEEPDSPIMYQVGDRIITLNCRRPYSGWGTFKQKILGLIKIIEGSKLVPLPVRHSLRYIDFMTLDPAPNHAGLKLSLKLGQFDIQSLPMQIRIELPDGDCTHIVQVATPASVQFPEGTKEGTILDLETLSTRSASDWTSIARQTDHLHERSKALFFEHILTAEAIESMEPEY